MHAVAEWLLKDAARGRRVDPAGAVHRARARADAEIADARALRHRLDPKGTTGFVALEYGEDPGDAAWAEVRDDLAAQLDGLIRHPLLRRMLEVPDRLVEIERMARTRLGGVPVTVSLDALVSDGQGGLVIVDWKTGRDHDPDEVADQLAVYAAYVTHAYGVPVDRVVGLQASTRTGAHTAHPLDAARVEAVTERATASAAAMRALHPNPARDAVPEHAAPPLEMGSAPCGRCRFRRVCNADIYRPLMPSIG